MRCHAAHGIGDVGQKTPGEGQKDDFLRFMDRYAEDARGMVSVPCTATA